MHRPRLIIGALAASLAMPAAASAAGTIVTNPIKVKSYGMTLIATDNGSKDSLSITFQRQSGKSSQLHSYSFSSGVKVTSTSISGKLGKYGSLKLKLGKVKTFKSKLPKGCTGTLGTTRVGSLTGSFTLVADSTYFRTVKKKAFKATTSRNAKLDCTGRPGTGGGDGGGDGPAMGEPMLTHTKNEGGAMLMLTAMRSSLLVMQSEDPATTAPASISHMINVAAPGLTNLTATSATVPGQPPFVTGQGSFAGEALAPNMATGTLSGNLLAKFDSIPQATLAGDAVLMNAGG